MSGPAVDLQPRAKNFWLGSKDGPNRTALFDECRSYLSEADTLIRTAQSLFASTHDG
jgi:hypothetical protein